MSPASENIRMTTIMKPRRGWTLDVRPNSNGRQTWWEASFGMRFIPANSRNQKQRAFMVRTCVQGLEKLEGLPIAVMSNRCEVCGA